MRATPYTIHRTKPILASQRKANLFFLFFGSFLVLRVRFLFSIFKDFVKVLPKAELAPIKIKLFHKHREQFSSFSIAEHLVASSTSYSADASSSVSTSMVSLLSVQWVAPVSPKGYDIHVPS